MGEDPFSPSRSFPSFFCCISFQMPNPRGAPGDQNFCLQKFVDRIYFKLNTFLSASLAKVNHHRVSLRSVTRGRATGAQLPGRRVTIGAPNHCGDAEKSKLCHKRFLQCSTLASERSQFRTWGGQTCFLPRAPSNLVTPLVSLNELRRN